MTLTVVELALKDRLQPALLDRLIDDERSIVLFKVATSIAALEQLGLSVAAFVDFLRGQGLSLQRQDRQQDALLLQFSAPRERTNPAQLRAMMLRLPATPRGVALDSFATVEAAVVANIELEALDRRMMSMRRLRESVHRDLGWLFNSMNLDSAQDLSGVPLVAASVVNYGLPSFAGRMTSSIKPLEAAERLRKAIECFEPRLSSVRVRPRERQEGEAQDDGTLEFTIEADLWGQPLSQHLRLRTTIDVMSGDVSVAEERGR